MKRWFLVALVALTVLPAAALGGTHPHPATNCHALLHAMGETNFRHTYGNFGHCVSTMSHLSEAQQHAILNAARMCRAEQLSDPAAFSIKWGRNANDANAFGKCVSVTAHGGSAVATTRATGDLTFAANNVAHRHVVFDVHTATRHHHAGGTFRYSDATSSYTVRVACVAIAGNSVYIGGQVQNATGFNPPLAEPTYLLVKAVDNGTTGDTYSGSFTATDPCGSLGTRNPGDGPFPVTSGSITIR